MSDLVNDLLLSFLLLGYGLCPEGMMATVWMRSARVVESHCGLCLHANLRMVVETRYGVRVRYARVVETRCDVWVRCARVVETDYDVRVRCAKVVETDCDVRVRSVACAMETARGICLTDYLVMMRVNRGICLADHQ